MVVAKSLTARCAESHTNIALCDPGSVSPRDGIERSEASASTVTVHESFLTMPLAALTSYSRSSTSPSLSFRGRVSQAGAWPAVAVPGPGQDLSVPLLLPGTVLLCRVLPAVYVVSEPGEVLMVPTVFDRRELKGFLRIGRQALMMPRLLSMSVQMPRGMKL